LNNKSKRAGIARAIVPAVIMALTLTGAPCYAPLAMAANLPTNLPDLGDSSDAVLSEAQERAIAKRIMLDVRGERSVISDPELTDYINQLGNRLVTAAAGATTDQRRTFEFFLLEDDSINAFALPGGVIGAHTGLMIAAESESELAGVLGHEVAHVTQRHIARGSAEQKNASLLSIATLALAVLAARSGGTNSGQATEAALMGGQALAIQAQLDYTREFEREADRVGITILQRAGFDVHGMANFFDRLLKLNRHNDGKTPGYLRTHPLTTERISDMQNRIGLITKTSIDSSPEFRFARAKLRSMSMTPNDGEIYFRGQITEKSILRDIADVYGLILSYKKQRNFAKAEKELKNLGTIATNNSWFELVAAELKAEQKQWKEAVAMYRLGAQKYPGKRGFSYGYIDALYESGLPDEALVAVNEKLGPALANNDDYRLHELAAKGYAIKGKRVSQHRSLAEAYYRRGNLTGAIEQLDIAIRAKDGNYYESTAVEARRREFRSEYKNRLLLPGEKRQPEGRETRDSRPDERTGEGRNPS
jgi:beta-barrel assembly-enhancing protease